MAHFLADPPDDLKPFDFDDKDGGDDFDDEIGGRIDEDFIPDEDLYDAINDETFGEEMAALTADDDFADFAIRTANLALFDDEPSTSLEPPDPSQIPIPQIDRSQNLQFIDSHSHKTTALKKKNVIPSVPPSAAGQIPSSSIWATGSFNGIGSLSELYMGNQPKPTSQESTHQHSFQTHSIDIDQLPNFSSSIGPPPGLFKPQTRSPQQQTATTTSSATGPLNAEELERKMLQEVAASQMKNQNRPIIPPASVNSAELEHKMLAEAMEAQQRKKQEQTMQEMMRIINGGSGQKTPMTMMTTPTMPNTATTTMTPPPPIWHQQYLTAMMIHAATAASNGNVQAQSAAPMPIFSNSNDHPIPPPMWSPNILPPPPPGNSSMPIPPPPHQIYQQWQKFLQQFAASNAGPGMPPPMMPPFPPSFLPPFPPGPPPPPGIHHPMAFHQQQNQNRPPPANASISTPIPHPIPPPPHLMPSTTAGYSTPSIPPPQIVDMVPASLHPQVEKQRRHRQANPALPSGKTIADYALDPYAGLMSTKEREWLIKIHIIQCLGTGDPMEDDFYYASWKQKNVLAKAPIVEGGQENPKYYKFEPTFPATNYTAPSFMGALGKPVHSSSRIPRQIIEVGNENLEDESLVGGKQTAANRQKRLRAMLMKIENGALMLIDCRDIHRKLRFFEDTCITEYIDKNEITERLERFAENLANVEASIFAVDQIPTVMLIQKGRQLVFEWLQFLGNNVETRPKILTFLGTLINGMNKFAKKIPEESFGAFIDGFRSAFMQIPCQMDLLNLVRTVNVETTAIADSKLIQLALLTILIQLVQQNVANSSSSSSTPTTPITLPFSLQQLFDSPIYSLLFDIQMAALKIQSDNAGELMHFDKGQWKLLRQWLIGEKQKWGQIIGFGQDNLANWICLKKWRR